MRLLADECMPRLLVERLLDAGHDMAWTVEDAAGDADKALLARSASEERVLISRDYDFGDLAFEQRLPAVGIVLVALGPNARKEEIADRVMAAVTDFGDRLRGRFTTLEQTRTRQRDLPAVADRT